MPSERRHEMSDFIPAQKLHGVVDKLYAALGEDFETAPLNALTLGYEGIAGDRHAGKLRPSGAREPWYPRGTEMANERQLSILAEDELGEIASRLEVDAVRPEWIGGNIVLAGIPHLSLLPPRTLLLFEGGVTIRVDGANGPCRQSGRGIARHYPDRSDIELGFVKAARQLRGLVGWIERAGVIALGEAVTVRIWEQRRYPPA